jgi:hypothetical protein
MVHLDDAQHLVTSAAAGCPFCDLIVCAGLQHNSAVNVVTNSTWTPTGHIERDVRQLEDALAPQPMYLQTNYAPSQPSPRGWHNGKLAYQGTGGIRPCRLRK